MKRFYENFAKRTLLSILIVHLSLMSFAATYYVSSAGSDSNSGLTAALAWKTLAKVNAATFVAGDQILFERGDAFYGSITVKNSGAAGNPITYGAYGTGENPIITGFTTISTWTNEGNGIYSKVITSDVQTNMVTVDDVNTAMGRYPNTGFLSYESFSSNVSITDTGLGISTNWLGAESVIRKNDWTIERCKITNHTGDVLTFSGIGQPSTANYGYFIQNDLRTLDQFGEWYHNTSTSKFYMYFGTVVPTSKVVKVATVNNLVGGSSWCTNITFQNITFSGCANSAINSSEGNSNYTINNCSILFCGQCGIVAVGTGDRITNNQISDCGLGGIRSNRPNAVITNNTITNIGIIAGQSIDGANNGISIGEPNNVLVQDNVIQNIGYNGIFLGNYNSSSTTVKNNFINNTCLVLNDGGGIYTGNTHINLLIDGNIILNSIGNVNGGTNGYLADGIYLDDYAKGITVTNNTTANCSHDGIKLHKSSNCIVSNNTTYNNTNGIEYLNSDGVSTITGQVLSGNRLVAKTTSQLCLLLQCYTINDTQNFGITANNNYYARPIADNTTIQSSQPSNWSNNMTLSGWQTFKGQDINSKKSSQTIASVNDLQFEYNVTSTAKIVALSQPMIDVIGTKYSGSITLQPFTSTVLMKDLTPVVVPGAPTSPVATAGNASASVTFVAPASNGGSVITGYTVTSVPAGGIDANAGTTLLTHSITGLTNGTSYTFTVKATNSAGTSVASVASNSVIPKAPVANTFTFTGPASGNINSASTNFTVTPNNLYTGTITLTPSGVGSVGLSVKVLTFTSSSTAQTFTITPTVAGSITLTPTNNGSLTNPANLTYLTNAIVPGSPTSPVAIAGNASASVAFVAPASNGGSAITGYTVTSVPAGGIDANAGSTLFTHSITGLTNGTSYTFTVKVTNSIGSSVASVASNLVIPTAPVATAFTFTGPASGNVNSTSTNFTVTPNNSYTGIITITPTGIGSAGLSAKVLTFANSSTAQTFNITPTVSGSITLTPTNNSTLTNPANLNYTVNAVLPNAPASVIATAGNGSASVAFLAPTNNGGSAINGYTVTSIPSGGIDVNAGSTLLTHSIVGLTNGTSYTFTVKATNSIGTSVASVASNSVKPIEVVVIKQGEITPTHFTTVWQGSNGLNHMNIIVSSATMEDLPLSIDDEIAVFSGTACVGLAKLTKSILPSDNTSFLTILASQSDGSGNGFVDNDTILFKVWDNKNQIEMQINGAVYRNDVATWKTTGRYMPGSTAMVEITSYKVYTQSIELLKGYNMISTYVTAQNSNVTAVTKSLLDQGNLIKMQDETGNSFENWGDFGGWVNNLGSLEKTEGYKIQVANNCTLQVTGRPIALPLDINLKTGWNIISFPRTDMIDAISAVQSLIDQNSLVKVQDEAGNSIENWGLYGGWKNGIGNFIPGKAYKVKMSANAILTFQENYTKSAVAKVQPEETEYFKSSVEGNGTDHMNINITGLNSIGISVGDELAAFDGDICVGTTKITEANLMSSSTCLVSSYLTDNQNKNGFKVGDPIQITLWSKLSGNESKVNAEILNGQMKYEKNASVLINMKSATIVTGIVNLEDTIKINVFPNPCQGQVTVRFSEIPEPNSRIEILDISGRKLITRIVSGTSEEFNLESFTSGLYLVRSILGSNEYIHKLIVNK